jgi:hypothetical protein
MTAVLIESTSPGESGWTRVNGTRKGLRISGMQPGDQLRVHFWRPPGTLLSEDVKKDKIVEIPNLVQRVRVLHAASSGQPVSVDLI